MDKAETKHPKWPSDPLHQAMIIIEETGEVAQAILDMIENGNTPGVNARAIIYHNDHIRHEVAQVGAMALRWLINYKPFELFQDAEDRSQ